MGIRKRNSKNTSLECQKTQEKLLRKQKEGTSGITLVALVVTIVVLIILATITVNIVLNGGIANKTEKTKELYENQEQREQAALKDMSEYMDKLFGKSGNKGDEIQRIEEYIGDDFKTAVNKGYVSKSQYAHQITGDIKKEIESEIGKQVDYSSDRFYKVKMENIELDDIDKSREYIYDSATGDVIDITGMKTNRNIATWFWYKESKELEKAILQKQSVQNDFFDKIGQYNITEIYVDISTSDIIGNQYLKQFVKNAYQRDIKVYLSKGSTDYLDEGKIETTIHDAYDLVSQYNSSADVSEKVAGINYNAEVWLDSASYNWKGDETTRKKHIELMKEAKEYSESKGLEAIFTLPSWLVQYDYTNDTGEKVNMYDEVTKMFEEVNLMIYRNEVSAIDSLITTTQGSAPKTIWDITQANDCVLNIAVEASASSEGDNISFYEKELASQGTIMSALGELENKYAGTYDGFVFSIHHAIKLLEFLGGISTENVIEISTPDQLEDFLKDTTGYANTTIKLKNDINMEGRQIEPYGADVTNVEGFEGTFDGENHSISNFVIDTTVKGGLFAEIRYTGIVKNLNIKDATIKSTEHHVGSLAGTNKGKIINCGNIRTSVNGKQYVGGLVGRNYGTIQNSFNTGAVTSEKYMVGGITGQNEDTGVIKNVYSTGTITENGNDGQKGSITYKNIGGGTIQKAYWMTGSCSKGMSSSSVGELTEKSSDDMKKDAFVSELNANRGAEEGLATWKIDAENDGYPHF